MVADRPILNPWCQQSTNNYYLVSYFYALIQFNSMYLDLFHISWSYFVLATPKTVTPVIVRPSHSPECSHSDPERRTYSSWGSPGKKWRRGFAKVTRTAFRHDFAPVGWWEASRGDPVTAHLPDSYPIPDATAQASIPWASPSNARSSTSEVWNYLIARSR